MNAYQLPDGVKASEGDVVYVASDDFDALTLQPTRVFKAGNSLAIRIPMAIAKRIGLGDGNAVEVAVQNGMIFIRKPVKPTLESLIDQITPENVHGPVFEGLSGNERW